MRAADLHAAYSRPAPLSCPTEVELDVSGVPDGVTAYFVGDGGVLLPPPITTIIGAEFTLVLSATAHQLDAHTFALATGVHTLSVLAHPIDPNLNDGFHPTGAAPLVRLTVSPVTLDVEALPSELRAGSSQTMPVSVWRDAALVGPVSVTGSSSGGFRSPRRIT